MKVKVLLAIFIIAAFANQYFGQNTSRTKQKKYYEAVEIYKNPQFSISYEADSANSSLTLFRNDEPILNIDSLGRFSFGKNSPQYKLDVCGTIRASEELIVETNDWCDYVFHENYKLQPLSERLNLIKKQKHLPYLKPEKSVTENGIQITETIKGLLQNIEELYLYIEILNERINNLENENQDLKQKCLSE
ncbi:MAG: hypothetical protein WHW07_01100 [Bacteroidales bacterium]|jgi:hypothetical protein